ncbi:MAG: nucleoid occlusion factor SlmA [SAR86 cluster bacterium]|nr:nucleoid occlusion factor SlmA [SAR86 cluster bacterium]
MTELKPRQLEIMQKLIVMLEKKGPVKVTTALLAKECEITEGAIYRHFPSKRKIYEGLVDFCERNIFALISKINNESISPLEKIQKILKMLIIFCEKNPGLSKLLTREAFSENEAILDERIVQIFSKIELHIKQNFQKYEQETKKKLALSSSSSANLLLCLVEGSIQQFVRSGFTEDASEKFGPQIELLIKSIS